MQIKILNPFGAVETTKAAFSDANEEHPNYEAIRAAYENAMMAPGVPLTSAEPAAFEDADRIAPGPEDAFGRMPECGFSSPASETIPAPGAAAQRCDAAQAITAPPEILV